MLWQMHEHHREIQHREHDDTGYQPEGECSQSLPECPGRLDPHRLQRGVPLWNAVAVGLQVQVPWTAPQERGDAIQQDQDRRPE